MGRGAGLFAAAVAGTAALGLHIFVLADDQVCHERARVPRFGWRALTEPGSRSHPTAALAYSVRVQADLFWLRLVFFGVLLALFTWIVADYHAEALRVPLRCVRPPGVAARAHAASSYPPALSFLIFFLRRYPERVQRALQHFSMSYNRYGDGQLHLVNQRLPRRFVDDFYRYRDRMRNARNHAHVANGDADGQARAPANGQVADQPRRRTSSGDGDSRAGDDRASTRAHSPYNLRPHAGLPSTSPASRATMYS